MRTHTPTPDTLPDNVALRLFRLQDAVQHAAYGGWWARGHDQYILPPTARAGCVLQYTDLASNFHTAALDTTITFATPMTGEPTIPHTETMDELGWRRMKRLQDVGLITINGRGGKRTVTFNATHPAIAGRLASLVVACLSQRPKDADDHYGDLVIEQLQYLQLTARAVARKRCFEVEKDLGAPEGSLEPIIAR